LSWWVLLVARVTARIIVVSLIGSLLLSSACATTSAPAPRNANADTSCRLAPPSEVLLEAPKAFDALWTLKDEPRWWGATSPVHEGLRRFRAAVQKTWPDAPPGALLDTASHNQGVSRSGNGGRIVPIRCLEAALLARQIDRGDMVANPTEFVAFILRKEGQLRVYTSTRDRAGLKMPRPVIERIERDHAAGWQLWTILHNHNFFFDKAPKGAGPTSPSKPDIHLFRNFAKDLGLQEAWVTNGFHTILIERAQFALYEGFGD